MSESAGVRPCPLCSSRPFDEAAMAEVIEEYLACLPAETWASAPEYERRLALCRDCRHQRGGTCLLCGCFIRTRAAKWFSACPDVAEPRWGRVERVEMG